MKTTKRLLWTSLVGIVALGLSPMLQAATPLNAIISVDNPAGNTGDARVRVVHASPDAPAVDVLVNGGIVFENVPFEGIEDFVSVPAGSYEIQVVPTGMTEPVVIDETLSLDAATDYTVIATDYLNMISPSILTANGGGPAAGNVWVRFFHASPDTPAVDIAVTNGPLLFENVAFQQGTDYLEVAAGTYDLEARVAGTMTVGLALPNITLVDGNVYTVYATGLLADVGAMEDMYFVPGVARAGGAQGSSWSTDIDIQNAGTEMASFKYLWLPRDADNASPSASDTFMLAAGESLRHADVLAAAFGVTDATRALGALALMSDSSNLKIFSRTFNTTENGTYGQGMPGIPSADLIPANVKKRILFFTENDDYRSNIGVLNGTGEPMTIQWERFTADGTMVDAASAELPAWGNVQLDRVFLNEAPVVGGYIDVWTNTEGASFAAYGSVLDNATSDPTTVLPQ